MVYEEGRVTDVRTRGVKVSCEDCFFHRNLLCAVSDAGPCATYRPNHPDGLRPPSQLRFVFRQDRRRVVFAAVYWPLIIGFVCLVLVTILIGWIVEAPRRRGTDRH
jgi:hypothetical protein